MATRGLRHAVLWVANPTESAAFYEQALGLATVAVERDGDAVFMSSPASETDHDLGLFRATGPAAGNRGVGLYHMSWEIATLQDLVDAKARLADMGALVGENNHGVSRSLYCHDPDGIEFEIMWEVPLELLDNDAPRNVPLDLQADIARWGADCLSRGA